MDWFSSSQDTFGTLSQYSEPRGVSVAAAAVAAVESTQTQISGSSDCDGKSGPLDPVNVKREVDEPGVKASEDASEAEEEEQQPRKRRADLPALYRQLCALRNWTCPAGVEESEWKAFPSLGKTMLDKMEEDGPLAEHTQEDKLWERAALGADERTNQYLWARNREYTQKKTGTHSVYFECRGSARKTKDGEPPEPACPARAQVHHDGEKVWVCTTKGHSDHALPASTAVRQYYSASASSLRYMQRSIEFEQGQ